MSKLDATDIQGFVLRGYNMPFARYCFLHFDDAARARTLIYRLLGSITTGQLWDQGKPRSTVNIAFTHRGLVALELPLSTLISFPDEFQLGMRARGNILGDAGLSSPDHWDEVWRENAGACEVHAWLGLNALDPASLDERSSTIQKLLNETDGARLLAAQDAASIVDETGKVTLKEHFGFTDGFGNPDYAGICRGTQPGQGKLVNGQWTPLATGELLLGHADEAGELPVAPVPHLLAANGTFMVYRKLHQNVGTFRHFLDTWAAHYGAGDALAREKLASKLIGRWRDGTPVEVSPDQPDYALTQDPKRSTAFLYGEDASGARCPVGAHVRRVHPRDAFGFEGRLVNRRRITRRGMPYGPFADEFDGSSGDPSESDKIERGVIFMALNASLARQFEFVQQQWVNYGNDAHLGNEKDVLIGNHRVDGQGGGERAMIQGDASSTNPPLMLSGLPNFVELRGGEYFFLPSITALGMIALGLVDPR